MSPTSDSVARLICRLDAATGCGDHATICAGVERALIEEVAGGLELPAAHLRSAEDSYARHLLHKTDDYAVVIMVWGPDQGTPIHDHDGMWCVECVYQGTIRVLSYDLVGSVDDEIVSFREALQVSAGKGSAGSLIPPFDYHVIENENDDVAVTIHVYGGEMQGCHAFVPVSAERYRRERRQLVYTP